MGIWAWLLLFTGAALLAVVAQVLLFHKQRGPVEYDWMFIAGGAVIGGLLANVLYVGIGPVVDGLHVVPTVMGAIAVGSIVNMLYRVFIRPRQPA
jgi:membrane-associated HD superfamily phosphohydrolase